MVLRSLVLSVTWLVLPNLLNEIFVWHWNYQFYISFPKRGFGCKTFQTLISCIGMHVYISVLTSVALCTRVTFTEDFCISIFLSRSMAYLNRFHCISTPLGQALCDRHNTQCYRQTELQPVCSHCGVSATWQQTGGQRTATTLGTELAQKSPLALRAGREAGSQFQLSLHTWVSLL